MKITRTLISVFLLTFLIGLVSIILLRNSFVSIEIKSQTAEKIAVETPVAIKIIKTKLKSQTLYFTKRRKTSAARNCLIMIIGKV